MGSILPGDRTVTRRGDPDNRHVFQGEVRLRRTSFESWKTWNLPAKDELLKLIEEHEKVRNEVCNLSSRIEELT